MSSGPLQPDSPAPGTRVLPDIQEALRFMAHGVTRRVPLLVPGALAYGMIALVTDAAPTLLRILLGDQSWIPAQNHDGAVGILLPGMEGGSWMSAVLLLVQFAASLLWTSALYRFGDDLLRTEGDTPGPTVGRDEGAGTEQQEGPNPQATSSTRYLIGTGPVIGVIVLTDLAMAGGLLLCILPGLVLAVILFFAASGTARGAATPFSDAVATARDHLGATLLTMLICGIVGPITDRWALAAVVAQPFLTLFTLGMFERLSGRRLPQITTPAR